jgi:hypothetical protein
VAAHNNIVQQIQNGGTKDKGLHFAAEENAMIVQLGIVCTSNVRVKEALQKMKEVVHSGNTHYQFNTIFICKVVAMVWPTVQQKKGRQSVHVNLDKFNKKEDSDGGEGDKKMAEQVGSNANRP